MIRCRATANENKDKQNQKWKQQMEETTRNTIIEALHKYSSRDAEIFTKQKIEAEQKTYNMLNSQEGSHNRRQI